ncbi:MAG: NHLP leader peptide family RiPP precursor [bacterium]
MNATTKSVDDLHGAVIAESCADENFRAGLLSDPKAALQDKLDVHIPDNITIHVHESTEGVVHLVLPMQDALNEEQLTHIIGGGRGDKDYCFDDDTESVASCIFKPTRW